jgi:hypothetical protein
MEVLEVIVLAALVTSCVVLAGLLWLRSKVEAQLVSLRANARHARIERAVRALPVCGAYGVSADALPEGVQGDPPCTGRLVLIAEWQFPAGPAPRELRRFVVSTGEALARREDTEGRVPR